jgi:polyisoprenoid-binding protein YceI
MAGRGSAKPGDTEGMGMTAVQTAPVGAKTVWKLDPAHTLVEFSAKHLMISTVKGRITGVDGIIRIDENEVANSSVEATLDARTLDTRIEPRDQHLRSADFLDVEKFPAITFRSTKIEGDEQNFKLTGDLTIRDITRPITLEVTFEGQTKDPWGGERVGFSATGKFDRRDYGLTWNVLLESGGLTVGNDIKISLEVEAIRQAE